MKKIRLFCSPYVGITAPMPHQWKGWRLTEQLDSHSQSHSHSIGIRLNVQTHGGEPYPKKKKINYLKFKFSTKKGG